MVKVYAKNGSTAYNICNYVLNIPKELELCDPRCANGSVAFIVSTSELYIKQDDNFKNMGKLDNADFMPSEAYDENMLIAVNEDGMLLVNGHNTNINVITKEFVLPDASEYVDGTILLAKDGKFEPVEGYGYPGTPMTFSWDGTYDPDKVILYDMTRGNGEIRQYAPFYHLTNENLVVSSINGFLTANLKNAEDSTMIELKDYDHQEFSMPNEDGSTTHYGDVFSLIKDGNDFLLYNVINEDFWQVFSAENYGVGLFVMLLDDDLAISNIPEPGEFMFSEIFDSLNIDLTLRVGGQKIDPSLYEKTSVSINQQNTSGTSIATITINNESTTLYAPSPISTSVYVNPAFTSGTNIGTINVNGNTKTLYVPSQSSNSPSIWVSSVYNTGTPIGYISINNNQKTFYIPDPPTITIRTSSDFSSIQSVNYSDNFRNLTISTKIILKNTDALNGDYVYTFIKNIFERKEWADHIVTLGYAESEKFVIMQSIYNDETESVEIVKHWYKVIIEYGQDKEKTITIVPVEE